MELLAPAGSLEKLKIALIYGADAIYFGLPGFSLRARASQFKKSEIKEGVKFCRKMGKKFYVALNIYAHNVHIDNLEKQLDFISEIKPDGIILSDPGILRKVKKKLPEIDIHLSTQANATNKEAVEFWQEQGVKRVILAREVSLKEVKEIKKAVLKMELEYFVHGAMCMAYSGRCILSKWMLGRSANLGDCAQPCRWAWNSVSDKSCCRNSHDSLHSTTETNSVRCSGFPRTLLKREISDDSESQLYLKTNIIDDKNRFEIDVEENENGTFLFNSNDICLIENLSDLMEAGIDSIKIEGRNKSVYYVAMVVRAYRKVLDVLKKGDEKKLKKEIQKQKKEIERLSNRGYWTGFAFENEPPHLFDKASVEGKDEFVGISLFGKKEINSEKRKVFVHNCLKCGDKVEVVTPEKVFKNKIIAIEDEGDNLIQSAHGGQGKIFRIEFNGRVKGDFVLRKKELC